jgi:hypothetical protein
LTFSSGAEGIQKMEERTTRKTEAIESEAIAANFQALLS